MKQIKAESERLIISPKSLEEMNRLYESEQDEELKKAYGEMIDSMKKTPEQEEWSSDWTISLRDGQEVGGIGFKGMADENGTVDVGYQIWDEFCRNGYAGEAVGAMVDWCFQQPAVCCVKAETAPDNEISQKVLKKNGFVPNGFGEEGPIFEKRKPV